MKQGKIHKWRKTLRRIVMLLFLMNIMMMVYKGEWRRDYGERKREQTEKAKRGRGKEHKKMNNAA